MPRYGSQCRRVLNYIMDFGSITRAQAMTDLGIANLPAVIEVLRNHKGYDIDTDIVTAINRYGETVHYAKYTLPHYEIRRLTKI